MTIFEIYLERPGQCPRHLRQFGIVESNLRKAQKEAQQWAFDRLVESGISPDKIGKVSGNTTLQIGLIAISIVPIVEIDELTEQITAALEV